MKPNYGIDAPVVVRNLFLFALFALLLTAVSCKISNPVWFRASFLYCSLAFLSLLGAACWIIYSSLILKPRLIANLVDELKLTGGEKVLDVGCGRGMLLIEAAKRLDRGKAYGIDLWTEDQSGNRKENTLVNADKAGVGDRIEIHTADMRNLPFRDGTFDAVVSNLAIHNIPDAEGRRRAIEEIVRVLKPGGKFALLDLHYVKDYAAYMERKQVHALSTRPTFWYCPPIRCVKGKK